AMTATVELPDKLNDQLARKEALAVLAVWGVPPSIAVELERLGVLNEAVQIVVRLAASAVYEEGPQAPSS
ncbi:MAG: hypothetical protein ACREB6_04845, partial [Rhodospirillales bacterium]